MGYDVYLVAGIPGTGKSEFCCEYLAGQKGWLRLDIDLLEGGSRTWPDSSLAQGWAKARDENDPVDFVSACQRTGSVVIDWGFPVCRIRLINAFGRRGVQVRWFDGDVATAREMFQKRGDRCLADFDRQVADLSSTDVPSVVGA